MIKINALSVIFSVVLLAGCGGNMSSSDDPVIDTFEVLDCPAVATHTSITEANMELINNAHRFVELLSRLGP